MVNAVANPGLGTDVLILTSFVWWSSSASRRRPSLSQFFYTSHRTRRSGFAIRTLPEPQFLDRPPPHSTLEGGHFHPTPCDDAAARSTPNDNAQRLTRGTTNNATFSRDRRCSPLMPLCPI